MRFNFLFTFIIAIVVCSCSSRTQESTSTLPSDEVSVPEAYFTSLFIRDCCGFTGGDGTYSVLLPDGRTVWIFGDTFLGTVNPDLTRKRLLWCRMGIH